MSNPICVWDLTISEEKMSKEFLKDKLNKWAKKWAFQLEQGEETGYKHWQVRISLKQKARQEEVLKMFELKGKGRCSPTSNENRDNCFYVMKDETRLEGPWTDEDKEVYIPRQVRECPELFEWQRHIVNDASVWNTRNINIVYCPHGNIGKSILKTHIGVYGIGRSLPYSNDYKDIMRMVMDTPKKSLYIIDLPRAISKEKLFQFFSGVETLKDGYAFDDRYHFKEEYFDCPNIWIFMNTMPDLTLLSEDRWKIWVIDPFKRISLFTDWQNK